MTPPPLTVTALARQHDRQGFSSGVPELDSYLKTRAGQDIRRRIARVFVCCAHGSDSILGFYTLSSLSIDVSSLPQNIARKLPRHPIPAALIGRLAVSEQSQGQGIGTMLVADAVKRSLAVSEEMAIHALVVDAKDEGAERFYRRFGFLILRGTEQAAVPSPGLGCLTRSPTGASGGSRRRRR